MPTKQEIIEEFKRRKGGGLSASDLPGSADKNAALEDFRARKDSIGSENIASMLPIEEIGGGREIGIGEALAYPLNLVEMGADSLATGQPMSSLHERFKSDETYVPGDAAIEKVIPDESSWIARGAAKTAMDVVGDPLNLAGALARPSGGAMKVASKGVSKAEEMAAKIAGSLGDLFTGGSITSEGMSKAVNKFTPMEQIFAKRTFQDAGREFGEARDVGRKLWRGTVKRDLDEVPDAGREIINNASDLLNKKGVPGRAGKPHPSMAEAADNLDYAIDDLAESAQPTKGAEALLQRVTEMQERGQTFGPEVDSLLDHIRRMRVTPLENEKKVYPILQRELEGPGSLADSVWKTYDQVAPEMAAGRRRVSDAADMAVGRAGGHLTEMYRGGQQLADLRGAIEKMREGQPDGIAKSLTMIAAHYPEAWNAVVGALRIPPDALASGLDNVAAYIAKNPKMSQAATVAIMRSVEAPPPGPPVAIPDQPEPNYGQPPMPQPMPLAPPVNPMDAALMQETGLQSIVNGKIIDPMEREKFVDQVMDNDNLTPLQKSKIRIHLKKTGGEILPPDKI